MDRSAEPELVVREVAWDAAEAQALRDAMTAEIAPRYADRAEAMPLPAGMHVAPEDAVYVGIAYRGGDAVGHVALRRLGGEIELKRLYVDPRLRGAGVGRALLDAAEDAGRSLGAHRLILQTGDRQPEAAALYRATGWRPIPLFAPYLDLPYSLCFDKPLDAATP